MERLRTIIWRQRCEETAEIEKTMGISKKDKKRKDKDGIDKDTKKDIKRKKNS